MRMIECPEYKDSSQARATSINYLATNIASSISPRHSTEQNSLCILLSGIVVLDATVKSPAAVAMPVHLPLQAIRLLTRAILLGIAAHPRQVLGIAIHLRQAVHAIAIHLRQVVHEIVTPPRLVDVIATPRTLVPTDEIPVRLHQVIPDAIAAHLTQVLTVATRVHLHLALVVMAVAARPVTAIQAAPEETPVVVAIDVHRDVVTMKRIVRDATSGAIVQSPVLSLLQAPLIHKIGPKVNLFSIAIFLLFLIVSFSLVRL